MASYEVISACFDPTKKEPNILPVGKRIELTDAQAEKLEQFGRLRKVTGGKDEDAEEKARKEAEKKAAAEAKKAEEEAKKKAAAEAAKNAGGEG